LAYARQAERSGKSRQEIAEALNCLLLRAAAEPGLLEVLAEGRGSLGVAGAGNPAAKGK